MKIIAVSNFDDEMVSDILIAENVSEDWAKRIVKLMNTHWSTETDRYYYQCVIDEYRLHTFEP